MARILPGGGSFKVDQLTGFPKFIMFPRPSNMHVHLRTGLLQTATIGATLRPWKHVLVMPNNAADGGVIDTLEKMLGYRMDLLDWRENLALKTEFIMTIYLTSKLTPHVIEKMAKLPFPSAVKYYPPVKGATTGSGHGIPLRDAREVLHAMEVHGIRLLGHFETVHDPDGMEIPHERREGHCVKHELPRLRDKHPELKVSFEHATTKAAIEWVKADTSGRTTCTITPQAMLLTRPELDTLTWGVHAKCMPIAKTAEDRDAVLQFALSGDKRACLGDDTAPHPSRKKLVAFPEAVSGCYLPHSLAIYAMLFFMHHRLDEFVKFASFNGPDIWGLPRPLPGDMVTLAEDHVTDVPNPFVIPEEDDVVIPFGWTDGEDKLRVGMSLSKC
jgi:dihydroorotase